ncbi:hypothetical protein C9J85_00415 [Haloferax sp. wsp5]|nr:hypothetical protein C9J85_00415 [Haloferax sp. wsp5]
MRSSMLSLRSRTLTTMVTPKYSSPSPGPMRALGWSPTDWTASASRLGPNRDGLVGATSSRRADLPRRGDRNRRRSHSTRRRDGEFYRIDGDRLSIAARYDGVSSHAFGSRILDGGLAGDLLGDGRRRWPFRPRSAGSSSHSSGRTAFGRQPSVTSARRSPRRCGDTD